MSHELRTPLNAIIGFSQVLREGIFGEINAKQAEYLDDILTSGNHLLALINDVLDLSKVEAGQVQLELASVLDPRCARARRLDGARAGDEARRAGDAPRQRRPRRRHRRRAEGPAGHLQSALERREVHTAGGLVDVAATQANGEVRVSVADTGPGIAADDLDRIFQEFQQTEAGARHHEGTGLGLALSKRFVEMHGGRIWCDSEVGRGSTFVFSLPAGPAQP